MPRNNNSFITVTVGRLPGKLDKYALNGERTVAAALEVANLSTDGDSDVRVNGRVAKLDAKVSDGDTVLLTKSVSGN